MWEEYGQPVSTSAESPLPHPLFCHRLQSVVKVANDVVEPASAGLLIESLDIGWSGDRLKPQGKVRLKPAEN
jgi:hypothetical protein